jgi:biotin synthase-like enzyme
LDSFDFVRTIAVARILMPRCHVRLSAGRSEMNDELQALCFLAGANSIFYGEKLLTTGNPDTEHDQSLFRRLNIVAESGAGTPAGPATGAEVLRSPLAPPTPGAGFASHAESNAAGA